MGIVIVLIVLALIFGGLGFLIEGLLWLLVIAVVLLVAGAIAGSRVRSRL
ncbi:MAG: hypothetical protein M3471_02245 [Actinomycetota bacterium]|jgi:hypothetical protein|nr:hypothetical protein [Actinomycetota bacterium]